MQLGFVGLGKMGLNMVMRLLRSGHEIVAYDRSAEAAAKATRSSLPLRPPAQSGLWFPPASRPNRR